MFAQADKPYILRETDDWAALYKPPGMETVSQEGKGDLLGQAKGMLTCPGLKPAHRLDRDTSGAQLFAKTDVAEKDLTRLFRHRQVGKKYFALCLGAPRNRTGVINRNLSEWDGGRRPVRVVKKGGLEASTSYEMLAVSKTLAGDWKISALAFAPHQGRTHQIRVHAAAIGYPILGDDQYGDRLANKKAREHFGLKRQALHSWSLDFVWTGERIRIACPLPSDIGAILESGFDAPVMEQLLKM